MVATAMLTRPSPALLDAASRAILGGQVELVRPMRRFAEEEVVIPDGPYEGRRFRCERQPYTRLAFDAIDSGRWSRIVGLGPTQTGKTLAFYIVPAMYHLFELQETVILGVPDMEMARDKWREDLLPAIERSRYREWLPRAGGGSRGGRVESVQFQHGPTLKFMSGGGGDKARAGFTARVLLITETDGMDMSGGTSREADKITQLEARTRAYAERKRVYMECTVSTDTGRTWREYEAGSASRIVLPCPRCAAWIHPEREHLRGWQGADTAEDAREAARWTCPACSEEWTEDERREANAEARLLHRGQEIDAAGEVHGPVPRTDTLGFRWDAWNNMFATARGIGGDEWRAARAADEDNAEKEMRQFVWALPYVAPVLDLSPLLWQQIAARTLDVPRGHVPAGTDRLTIGVDVGLRLLYWVAIAWSEGATGHVVDYDVIEAPTDSLGVERGLMVAFRELRDLALEGWPMEGVGVPRVPDQVWIDAGYQPDVIYVFVRESMTARQVFWPAIGRGAGQQRMLSYTRPKQTGALVKHIGEGYHVAALKDQRMYLLEVNADHWKSWLHARVSTPVGERGALTLYATAAPEAHLTLAKHLTAEKQVEEYIAGKGSVIRWERIRKANHYFDAAYNACAAGHFAGVRLVEQPRPKVVARAQARTEEGRPLVRLPIDRPFVSRRD